MQTHPFTPAGPNTNPVGNGLHQALAAILLGAKTQWPQITRVELMAQRLLRDEVTKRVEEGYCFPEDRKVSMDQYIEQLDRGEPSGTGYTIHLVATAFDTTINIYMENLNGTVAMYTVYGVVGDIPRIQLPQWVKKLDPNHVHILNKGGIYYPVNPLSADTEIKFH